jgi:phosphoribosyl 1,2-cyclic phosphodiesterase
MSTFDGIISEFPDIRSQLISEKWLTRSYKIPVDFFRRNAGAQPPLACFLSHVHSDHLAGIESLRSPLYVPKIALSHLLTLYPVSTAQQPPKRSFFVLNDILVASTMPREC